MVRVVVVGEWMREQHQFQIDTPRKNDGGEGLGFGGIEEGVVEDEVGAALVHHAAEGVSAGSKEQSGGYDQRQQRKDVVAPFFLCVKEIGRIHCSLSSRNDPNWSTWQL